MREQGFTLIEMLIAIAVAGILLSMAALSFNSMTKNSAVDGQMKSLAADLMGVRSQALFEKRGRTVLITSAQFRVYSSNALSSPVQVKALKVPVQLPATLQVDFDSGGGTTLNADSTVGTAAVCADRASDAAVDSVVISRSRIQLGKLNTGACESANIDIK
jgi:type IV fimbrial biogenesis protein FimT